MVGAYTLSATLKGQKVYQSDLVLNDNAALYIAVVTDSFSFRNLRPVEVNAQKHLLGSQRIASADDYRLWNFSGQMDEDDRSASKDLSGNPFPFGLLTNPGLKPHPLGSTFKNELLIYGRILDYKRPPAPADTTAKGK